MKLGLQIPDFTRQGGAPGLRNDLARVVRMADEAGFDSLSVMDHLWQIDMIGPPEREMLEAYTTLGFMAAHSERAKLMTVVTGVVYRAPGLLAKMISTLDVLSGGRAWLGVGAAWNEEESRGLGLFFPPTAERFERLEEALQICLQMWSDDEGPYDGKYYHLSRTLSSPQALTTPHPPILIGGSGEKKTLRLVAKYAQACNLFPGPEIPHKLDVLREHCQREGTSYDDIEKTCVFRFDVGNDGERVDEVLGQLQWLSSMGIQAVIGGVAEVWNGKQIEVIGKEIIPAIAEL